MAELVFGAVTTGKLPSHLYIKCKSGRSINKALNDKIAGLDQIAVQFENKSHQFIQPFLQPISRTSRTCTAAGMIYNENWTSAKSQSENQL